MFQRNHHNANSLGLVRTLLIGAAVSALTLGLSSCMQGGGDGDDSGGGSACSPTQTVVVRPFQLDDKGNGKDKGHGHHLSFDSDSLELLLESGLEFQSVSLYFVLDGTPTSVANLSIDFNGIQASPAGNYPVCHRDDQGGHDDQARVAAAVHSQVHFDLDKMTLYGGQSIQSVMVQILLNHGQLESHLHGTNFDVDDAYLQFVFIDPRVPCPKPSPSATPSPKPSVSPTPSPSASPSPSPSPTLPPPPPPSPSPLPSPSPSPSPSPTPVIPPHTTITSVTPSSSPTSSTSISIAFTSDQIGVSFACSLDGAVASACSSPAVYSGLASGSHVFKVVATNSQGASDPTGASYAWSVDTTPPDVTITNAASLPSPTNSTSISLGFTSSKAGSTFQCSLDGQTAAACSSPVSYSGLAEGTHKVSISATDPAGNVSQTPATFSWVIDLTPPTTSITQVAPAQSPTNVTTMSLSFVANETATFACAIDSATFTSCTSPVSLNNLPDGQHSFSVRATDVAGNQGNAVSYLWTVDTTPPVITLGNVLPAANADTNAKSISVEFTANEQSTFVCSWGGVNYACTSPFTAPQNVEGPAVFSVRATDLAGNLSQPVSVSWTFDFTAPVLSFGAITPSAASYISSTSLSAVVNASESVTLACSLNGANLNIAASPVNLTGLAEGSYTLSVGGRDLAGNSAAAITHSFTVDVTPPVVSLSATYSGLSTNQNVNTFTFSANESATFQCNLDNAGYSACASPSSISGAAEGTHTYLVVATDLAGNVGQPVSVSWTVDTTPPVTTVTPTRSQDAAISFALSANEPVTGFQCSLDGAAYVSCSSPVSYSGLAAGSHTFSAKATDLAGNVETSPAVYGWTVDPAITTSITGETPSASLTNSKSISISFAASLAGGTFLCSFDGAAASACVSPATATNLADGTHSFKVQAVDKWGNVDATGASYSWSIDTVPPHTTITPTRTQNAAISFALSANEPVQSYQCSLDGAAFAACTTPIAFSNLAVGNHTFSAEATDLAGNLETAPPSYTWTVAPPITTSITGTSPATNITNQSTMSVSFTASQAGASFICSWDGAAAAPCNSPASISGVAAGSHTFVARAIDSWGTPDPVGATFNWTVDTTAPTVGVVTLSPTSTTITVAWSTSKPATSSVHYGVGTSTNQTIAEDSNYVTSHNVRIVGLLPNTLYTVYVSGHDQAGNAYTSAMKQIRTSP